MIKVREITGTERASAIALEGEGLSPRKLSTVEWHEMFGWYVRLHPVHPCYRTVEKRSLLFFEVVPFIQRTLRDEFFEDYHIATSSLMFLTDWMLVRDKKD